MVDVNPMALQPKERYNIAPIKGYQLEKFIRVVMSHSGQAIDKKHVYLARLTQHTVFV
ncbi:hypothetical protein [Yersinia pseudotuberculosis]|uniref:hypothetical protein n=1 Tax=Yersinia pseudotuberculosis TaxID=633 RepID=UPI0005DF358E|nr:hypothetical protein [Yersinia pseudotuberculosis]CNC48467.1 Uncharacterised protein [Yersinia pseudotuberculosis]